MKSIAPAGTSPEASPCMQWGLKREVAPSFGARLVEKYELVRTDRPGFTLMEQSPFITPIDILRARQATGLMKRKGYKAVSDITRGKASRMEQHH